MLNTNGVLAILDHHIGLNWDDGPTLLRVAAQVRYRFGAFAGVHTLRVTASSRCGDDPQCFNARNNDISAVWTLTEVPPGYAAQLAITNCGDDDVVLEGCDVVRIDAAYGGIFNLGAHPALWRVAHNAPGQLKWEQLMGDAAQITRDDLLLLQPSASNRGALPALRFSTLAGEARRLTRFELQASPDKFERFCASVPLDGMLLAPGVTIVTPEVWIVAGDDVRELRAL